MRRRKGWKRGDHLVRDEESGFVEYASKVRRDYYGVLKRKEEADPAHPQHFVRAKNDPYITSPQANPSYSYDTSAYNVSAYVYGTNIPIPRGPAYHLFFADFGDPSGGGSDPAIPDMAIGTDFVIR